MPTIVKIFENSNCGVVLTDEDGDGQIHCKWLRAGTDNKIIPAFFIRDREALKTIANAMLEFLDGPKHKPEKVSTERKIDLT